MWKLSENKSLRLEISGWDSSLESDIVTGNGWFFSLGPE